MDAARRYARYGRFTVEGWFGGGAADIVIRLAETQSELGIRGGGAEIGVHHGRLFILLALLMREGERAVAIDIFEDQERNVDRSGEGNHDKLKANIHRHVGSFSKVVIHKGDSMELTGERVKQLAGGEIRLFSVDGGHTEEITKHDLETAEAALCPGGVIVLDDCFYDDRPGVVSGVVRFLDEPRSVEPFAIGANKTLFASPDYALAYRSALRASLAKTSERRFLGHEVTCLSYSRPVVGWLRRTKAWNMIRDTEYERRLKGIYTILAGLKG